MDDKYSAKLEISDMLGYNEPHPGYRSAENHPKSKLLLILLVLILVLLVLLVLLTLLLLLLVLVLLVISKRLDYFSTFPRFYRAYFFSTAYLTYSCLLLFLDFL